MLKTPIGDIEIKLNDRVVDYEYVELSNRDKSFTVDKRYKLIVKIPDSKDLFLNCFLKANEIFKSGIDSGEDLAMITISTNKLKLSLGVADKETYETIYYMANGLSKKITNIQSDNTIIFGLAWVKSENLSTSDVSTWYAADPTLF